MRSNLGVPGPAFAGKAIGNSMTSGTILRRTGLAALVSMVLALAIMSGALATSAADTLDLEHHVGQVILLDFWASWCAPCRQSFPWMQDMQRRYRDDGLVVIAVNLDNDEAAAAAFLDRYPVDFRIFFDRERRLARKYDVTGMPTSLLIGRDGQVIRRQSGFKVKLQDRYERELAAALGLTAVSR